MSSVINKFFKFSFFFFVLFLISFSLVSCTKGNDRVEVASLEYKDNGDGTSTVIGIGNQYNKEDLVIPEKDNNGNIVTSIADEAFCLSEDEFFESKYKLRSIIMPDTISYIGDSAFANNYNLRKVILPNNKELKLGNCIFSNCNINSLVIKENTSFMFSYAYPYFAIHPYYMFSNNNSVVELYFLLDGNTYSSSELNEYVKDLLGIEPKVIHTSLDEESIIDDSNPNCITCKIEDDYYLVEYKETNEKNINNINNTNKNVYELPYSITYKGNEITKYNIFDSCFYYDLDAENIILPDSIESIGDFAFYKCINLKTINFPINLKSIGNYAFNSCELLNSISVPSSVSSIGYEAFGCCTNMFYVNLNCQLKLLQFNMFNSCINLRMINLEVIDEVENFCFVYCSSLKRINFKSGTKKIGYKQFSGCTNLDYVYIPKTVIKLDKTFDNLVKELIIEYEGTTEEWNNLNCTLDETKVKKVICSNGEINNN